MAVQPVLLDYSANRHFNPGWGLDESTPWHIWRLMTQLRTHIRLKILPVRPPLLLVALHRCSAYEAAPLTGPARWCLRQPVLQPCVNPESCCNQQQTVSLMLVKICSLNSLNSLHEL